MCMWLGYGSLLESEMLRDRRGVCSYNTCYTPLLPCSSPAFIRQSPRTHAQGREQPPSATTQLGGAGP